MVTRHQFRRSQAALCSWATTGSARLWTRKAEKAGIKIDDKEAFQKQVAYYYVDGQYEIDHGVLKGVPIPDVEDVFEELNIL